MAADFLALTQVATRLGLTMEPTEPSRFRSRATLRGVLDGRLVELRLWAADFLHVEIYVHFTWPGDLGLALAPAGVSSKLGELLGWHDVHVGDAAFDDAFSLRAVDAERARLLCTPEVRAALMAWQPSGASSAVTDDGVALWLTPRPLWVTGPLSSAEVHSADELIASINAARELARLVDGSLQSLPPSSALAAQAGALEAYAHEHGLTFRASPLGVEGALGGGLLAVHLLVQKDAPRFVVTLRFAEPLGAFLRVEPTSTLNLLARLRSPGHRVPTGDEAFDTRFRVLATDEQALDRLGQDARRALIVLHDEMGPVQLDAASVTLTVSPTTEPSRFAWLLDQLLALEAALRVNTTASGR